MQHKLVFTGADFSERSLATDMLVVINNLPLDIVGVWFKLQCTREMYGTLADDDAWLSRTLGLDPRVWRRARQELEDAGVISTVPMAAQEFGPMAQAELDRQPDKAA